MDPVFCSSWTPRRARWRCWPRRAVRSGRTPPAPSHCSPRWTRAPRRPILPERSLHLLRWAAVPQSRPSRASNLTSLLWKIYPWLKKGPEWRHPAKRPLLLRTEDVEATKVHLPRGHPPATAKPPRHKSSPPLPNLNRLVIRVVLHYRECQKGLSNLRVLHYPLS